MTIVTDGIAQLPASVIDAWNKMANANAARKQQQCGNVTSTSTTTQAPVVLPEEWVHGVSSACAHMPTKLNDDYAFAGNAAAPLSCARVLIAVYDWVGATNWCAQRRSSKVQMSRLMHVDTSTKYEWALGMLQADKYKVR